MRRLILAFALAVLAIAPGSAFAADVTGTWNGIFTAGEKWQVTISFKQDGTKLVGTVEGADEPIPIYDCRIEGDKISFNMFFSGNIIGYQGTVTGDVMSLVSKSDEGYFEGKMILKRVPSASTSPAAPASPQ